MSRWISALMFVTLAASGCASLGRPSSGTPLVYETDTSRAVRCLGLWNTGEAEGSDGRTSRGFAGQLYFFTANDPSPVAVNGTLRVFVFDDVGSEDEQSRPMHEFDIPAEALQGFATTTQLGPAYNIFVPYPRSGRHAANCSLRVRLTREDGSRVFSEMAEIKLTGRERPASVAQSRELPVADELPQQLLTRTETLGLQKNGTVLPVSNEQFARHDDNGLDQHRISAYEQKIEDYMRQQSAQPRPLDKPRVADRSGFERVVRDRPAEEPRLLNSDATAIRKVQPSTPTDEFEIRTLSRPLNRQSAAGGEVVPVDPVPVDLPAPLEPSAAVPANAFNEIVYLPQPEPFVPLDDPWQVQHAERW